MANKLNIDGDWSDFADVDLVLAFQNGARDAFSEIDRRYRPRLLRYIHTHVSSQETAEDLIQETMLRAFSALDSVRDGLFLAGWLKRIAFRTYVDWLRKTSRESSFISIEESETNNGENLSRASLTIRPKRPSGVGFSDDSPDNRISLKDECDNIWRTARRILSPLEFQVLWLRYADGLNDSEVALSLGKTSGAVRASLSRARSRLAKALKKEKT